MRRRLVQHGVALLVIAGALVGCLFPSFDDLSPATAPSSKGKTKKADAAVVDEEIDTPTGTPVPTPTPVGVTDSGGPDVVRGPPVVTDCHGTPCSTGPSQFCCVNIIGDPQCMAGTNQDCALLNFGDGRAFRCDGPEDCAVGQVCCFTNTAEHGGECTTTCGNPPPGETQVVCHSDADCPAGHPCNVGFYGMFTACAH